MEMQPVFTVRFGQEVEEGQVTVGKFDGKNPCMACGTANGKVFVHHPHGMSKEEWAGGSKDVSFLNLQKQVTGLAAGDLAGNGKDILMVGTAHELLAYDVQRNADIFHKDMPDGVLALTIGSLAKDGETLAFAGGNCSIQGFNGEGADTFWTVTGDNVCAMAVADLVGGDEHQLLVGSEDFDLRVFTAAGDVMHEFSETEAMIALCNLQGSRFGYALNNGAIGTYDGPERSWRAKMKARPVEIRGFDMTMDGVQEMVTAWSNGSVDVREDRPGASGEIMLQDTFKTGMAGLAEADYRMDGTSTLLAVSTEGEARGYLPLGVKLKQDEDGGPADFAAASRKSEKRLKKDKRKGKGGRRGGGEEVVGFEDGFGDEGFEPKAASSEEHSRTLRELEQEKQDLLREMKYYEQESEERGALDPRIVHFLMQCEISTELEVCKATDSQGEQTPHLRLTVAIPNRKEKPSIRCMVVHAEGIFEGDSLMVHPSPASGALQEISAVIEPPANGEIKLEIKLFIAPKQSSTQLIVRETSVTVPHFALFDNVTALPLGPPSRSGVTLPIEGKQYTHKVAGWLQAQFLLKDIVPGEEFHLVSLRDNQPCSFLLTQNDFQIKTPSMELASELIPSLLQFLDIREMNSVADFPDDAKSLRQVLVTVNEYQASRAQLTADMAEKSTLAKNFLFRAEDGRLLDDMDQMTEAYRELHALNRDLITTYEVRCSNHTELLKCLKVVNQHIQRAAKLRVGRPKAEIVAGCRAAIKKNDVESLFGFIKNGVPVGQSSGGGGATAAAGAAV